MKNTQIFSRITFLDKLLFTKHLALMTKSGITITEALDTLSEQTKSDAFKQVLSAIVADIRNGQSLASALEKFPHVFDHFYTSLIEVSEESGTLEKNLEFLAVELAKEYSLRKKIQGTLLYPAIVVTAMLLVGSGLSVFVLPKLVDLFSSLNVPLPLPTRVLLFLAQAMKDHGPVILLGIVLSLLFIRSILLLPRLQGVWDRLLLGLPLIGSFLQNGQLASMCRNLGVMIKSGLTIKSSLQVQHAITTNTVFRSYLAKLQRSVDKGKSLEDELTTDSFPFISPVAIRMIGVGEKTGKLDEIFLYLGDFFEEEVDDVAKNLTVILEPILLLIIGLIVGFVAVAIISPIYQLTGSIGH